MTYQTKDRTLSRLITKRAELARLVAELEKDLDRT